MGFEYNKVQKWTKKYVTSFIYFYGPRGCGKTSFIEQLEKRQDTAFPVLHTKFEKRFIKDEKNKTDLSIYDFGGDRKLKRRWFKELEHKIPIGIIFVVDHDNIESGKDDLIELFGALTEIFADKPISVKTRGIMLFINKYDLWEGKTKALKIAQEFEELIIPFKDLKIKPIIRWGCVKHYNQFSKYFEDALSDFYSIIMGLNKIVDLYQRKGQSHD